MRPINPANLVETFPIRLPDGREVTGSLLKTGSRPGGRRIVVHNDKGLLYDTDDCYDVGNASNKLEHWLRAQPGAEQPIRF